jgi:transcriptional regulator with XRE-family HTH domain
MNIQTFLPIVNVFVCQYPVDKSLFCAYIVNILLTPETFSRGGSMPSRTIGEMIRTERGKQQITMRGLARLVNEHFPMDKITFQVLSKWERNLSKIPAVRVQQIASVLRITPGTLYPRASKNQDQGNIVAVTANGHKEENVDQYC